MNGPVDPLRERDLPNAEAMLSSILSGADADATVEDLDSLDAPGRRPRRWLQVVAAAAAVAVIAGLGWGVTRPQLREVEPEPGAPVLPTPTPSQTVTPTPEPTPEPTRAAEPAPRTTPPPTRTTPTPAPTPSPTPSATPTPTPTRTPSPVAPTIDPPRVIVNSAQRVRSDREGYDIAVVTSVACPGSRGARIWGPWVDGPRVVSGEGLLSPGGTLVNRDTCISMTVEVEVPAGVPTDVAIRVQLEYAAGTPEAVNDGMVSGDAIIR
ncbi:hypothetical protein [Granulicoccus sp. GXG6511]|uniref:hypothetical protein n=1 Tax=Granulicoccus sp. GXG6511 TaxID=3381351 RepID=UPI003D7CE9CC